MMALVTDYSEYESGPVYCQLWPKIRGCSHLSGLFIMYRNTNGTRKKIVFKLVLGIHISGVITMRSFTVLCVSK